MAHERKTPFAGFTANGTDLPEWYSDKLGLSTAEGRSLPSLAEIVGVDAHGDAREDGGRLAGVKAVTPGYKDEESGEWVEVPDKRAVINPDWEGDGLADTQRAHALWQYASDRYTPVPPEGLLGPAIPVAVREDLTTFGVVEEYRMGGEVHVTMVMPDFRYEVGEAEYVLTYTAGYSHFGDQSLYYEVGAINAETGVETHLTERETCPHRGKARDKVAAWWESAFDNAESATSTLGSVMREAMDYVVPLKGGEEGNPMPYSLSGFYQGLGFPESLADAAASHVKEANTGGAEPETATALALYEGIATALTEDINIKTGGYQIRDHNKTANKLLFSPPSAEAQVINFWQTKLAEQETLAVEERTAKKALGERYGDTQAAIEHYTETKRQLKDILKEATASNGEAGA